MLFNGRSGVGWDKYPSRVRNALKTKINNVIQNVYNMNRKNKRIVNLRYMVDGLHFDAAIDCDWCLHCYDFEEECDKQNKTPIELYCFDKPEWDIRMMYYVEPNNPTTNDQQKDTYFGGIYNTCANLDEIIKETKAWIKEMENKN